MQFKLTVALLAALSVAEASHGHRAQYRHLVRRQGYGGYGEVTNGTTSAAESAAPTTTDAAVEESTTASLSFESTTSESVESAYPTGTGVADSTSVLPIVTPTGTAPAVPSGTGSPSSNETAVVDDELVTSTVSSTQIFTVTLCSSDVVNCPARSTTLVTTVIPVGTTVCPKSEVNGAVPTPEPTGSVVTASNPISEVTHEVVQTATITVGPSTNAHAITQTYTRTSVETIYQTVTLTRSKASSAAVPESSDKPVVGGSNVEGTTTLTSTSTSTQYITVHSTRTPVAGETGSAVELPTGTGTAGEVCAAPSTVTVTAQETVYVTVGNANSVSTFTPTVVPDFSTIGEAGPSSTADGAVTIETTITSDLPEQTFAPYPIKNGTHPRPQVSSGFLTFTKPAGYDTPVPTSTPDAESSVPVVPASTVYVEPVPVESSAAPVSSEAPVETYAPAEPTVTGTPVESSAAPAETSASVPSYGSYGRFFRR